MNVLIVYCHPSKESYTNHILNLLTEELNRHRHQCIVSDLYEMHFQTDMCESEYRRESTSDFRIALQDDIVQEHAKLDWADAVLFLYPVWWSNCPAKLKGWFDRVFTVGYAYKHKEGMRKMKTFGFGAVICTAGHDLETLTGMGIAQSMQTIMLDDKLGNRFVQKKMLILGGTLAAESVIQKHQKDITELIASLPG